MAGVTIRVLRKTAGGSFDVQVLGDRADFPVIPSGDCFVFHYEFNCSPEPMLR